MFKHSIDICPDSADELARRLDALADSGAEIVTVTWQPRRAQDDDQAAAFDTSGSFLIISRMNALADVVGLDEEANERIVVA